MTEKVVQLVVDKKVESAAPIDIEISMGAQIKYCDPEVTLVKTSISIAGQAPFANHFIVETPKK